MQDWGTGSANKQEKVLLRVSDGGRPRSENPGDWAPVHPVPARWRNGAACTWRLVLAATLVFVPLEGSHYTEALQKACFGVSVLVCATGCFSKCSWIPGLLWTCPLKEFILTQTLSIPGFIKKAQAFAALNQGLPPPVAFAFKNSYCD